MVDKDEFTDERKLEHQGVAAALRLLNRLPDPDYISEWTDILARPKDVEAKGDVSAVVFRLGKEWLAISGAVFEEVVPIKKVHRIPHRTNDVLRGLVNYQGLLTLCVCMHRFLGINLIPLVTEAQRPHSNFQRMVSIRKDHELWVFSVDEVHGIINFDKHNLKNAPVTLSKTTSNYLRGMISWEGKDLGYLDEELLFFGLKRYLL